MPARLAADRLSDTDIVARCPLLSRRWGIKVVVVHFAYSYCEVKLELEGKCPLFILAEERELTASRGETSESLFVTCGKECGFRLILVSMELFKNAFVGYCVRCLLVVKR